MKIVIDGRNYPMPDNFTFREMNSIKRMTGLRAGELFPALQAGDTDVAAAFALVALRRAGRQVSDDLVLDWQVDQITLDFSDEEDEKAGPPADAADAAPAEPPTPPASPSSTTSTPVGAGPPESPASTT